MKVKTLSSKMFLMEVISRNKTSAAGLPTLPINTISQKSGVVTPIIIVQCRKVGEVPIFKAWQLSNVE